jgi:hypothetical protein
MHQRYLADIDASFSRYCLKKYQERILSKSHLGLILLDCAGLHKTKTDYLFPIHEQRTTQSGIFIPGVDKHLFFYYKVSYQNNLAKVNIDKKYSDIIF